MTEIDVEELKRLLAEYRSGDEELRFLAILDLSHIAPTLAQAYLDLRERVGCRPISKAPKDKTFIEFRDDGGLYLGLGYWDDGRWNRIGCHSNIFAFDEILTRATHFTLSPFPLPAPTDEANDD